METAGEPFRRAMFSRIAPGYDRINAAISLGLDTHWRRALPRFLPAGWAPRRMLDVCCGTGALLAILVRAFPGAEAIGLDFAPGMLAVAAARFCPAANPPRLVEGDQNALPFADGCFDLATNAFGLRNSVDLRRALAEMHRVTAPGGVMAVLEITRPDKGIFARLFGTYFNRFVPALARCLGGDPGAYGYLPASVAGFVTRAELAGIAAEVWGEEAAVRPLFGSAVSLFLARKRARGPCHGVSQPGSTGATKDEHTEPSFRGGSSPVRGLPGQESDELLLEPPVILRPPRGGAPRPPAAPSESRFERPFLEQETDGLRPEDAAAVGADGAGALASARAARPQSCVIANPA